MKPGAKWKIADIVLGVVGGICGVVGILTSIKAADYDEESMFEDLEKKYGLTPINDEGEDE